MVSQLATAVRVKNSALFVLLSHNQFQTVVELFTFSHLLDHGRQQYVRVIFAVLLRAPSHKISARHRDGVVVDCCRSTRVPSSQHLRALLLSIGHH